MLIESPRQTKADIAEWRRLEKFDQRLSASARLEEREARALDTMRAFIGADKKGYIGVSWGKDSVVVAHMASRLAMEGCSMPLVWIRVEPIANPDCEAVRDRFLSRWPLEYEEITTHCTHDDRGWHATGTLEAGFREASRRHGKRHVSGVRAHESNIRKLSMRRNGTNSTNTCRPIGWWSGQDVFAYLHKYDLPVHPAYAMSFGGMTDRERLRVASLGGERGRGVGRLEWERRYYGDVLAKLA